MILQKPFFVALDLDDKDQVLNLAKSLSAQVGGFKIGPRLLLKYGASIAKELSSMNPLFIDHKFYDIPNTMLKSIQVCFDMGASYVTIHGASGFDAMKAIADLEAQLNTIRPFKILVVTVLTSFSESNKPSHWENQPIDQIILKFAEQIKKSGLTGVVCSPYEASLIKKEFKDFFIVTPGIRLSADSHDDQKRVMTPSLALAEGSSALVIGRSIVNAKDPLAVVNQINSSF